MSSKQPSGDHANPFPPRAGSPPETGAGSGKWIVFLILGFLGLCGLLCCGVFGAGYLMFQRHQAANSGETVNVQLPRRYDAFAQDAKTFNASIQRRLQNLDQNVTCSDPSLTEFIDATMALLKNGQSARFHVETFLKSIDKSESANGSVPLLARLILSRGLGAGETLSPSVDDHYELLEVRLAADGVLAEVDLLVYSSDNLTTSQQWYVVKADSGWHLYDWQRLEFGRRLSDKFAAYLTSETHVDDGYDEAVSELNRLISLHAEGAEQQAFAGLRRLEQKPMLAVDKPVAMLEFAYTWMKWEQHAEALRVMESCDDPNDRWGVWPIISLCRYHLSDYEGALEAARQAATLTPDHPNVSWLLAVIHSALNHDELAADAALNYLKLSPQLYSAFSPVVDNAREQDLDVVLGILLKVDAEQADTYWARTIRETDYSPQWAAPLLEKLAGRDGVPAGVREIVEGNIAWADDNFDQAATLYQAATRTAQLPSLIEIARSDYLLAVGRSGNVERLFRDADNQQAVLRMLVMQYVEDDLYLESQDLLDALDRQPKLNQHDPWYFGLRGLLLSAVDQNEPAITQLTRFADWLDQQDEADEGLPARESIDAILAGQMLKQERYVDVLERWPGDMQRLVQLSEDVIALPDAGILRRLLAACDAWTSQPIDILRQRLETERLFRQSGDADAIDAGHRQLLDLVDAVDSELPYWIQHQLRQRHARDRAWSADQSGAYKLPTATMAMPGHSDEMLERILLAEISAAEQLQAPDRLQQVARAVRDGRGSSHYVTQEADAAMAKALLRQGKLDDAVMALQASLTLDQDAAYWRRQERAEMLLQAALQAGNLEAARECIETHLAMEGIPTECWLELYQGNGQAVLTRLAGADQDFRVAVGRWLASPTAREALVRFEREPWVAELVETALIPLRQSLHHASGQALIATRANLSAAMVEQILARGLRQAFDVRPYAPGGNHRQAQGWLAASRESSERYALLWFPATTKARGLTMELAQRLTEPTSALTIEVLDNQPGATERLFQIASSACGGRGIAFKYEAFDWLWIGNDLGQQLRWRGHVPVNRNVLVNSPLEVQPLATKNDPERPDLEDWASRLEATDGAIEAEVDVGGMACRERLPVRVVSVDLENYSILITPQRDSVLAPWVRAGASYSASGYDVLPVD